ncbi:MAG TPA: DUF2130 domain-containing protein [Candidatus Acidoferrales bacterium]|nr:DUF2130 domain-containing protein [Candidatus Acidoferrales bacterium]
MTPAQRKSDSALSLADPVIRCPTCGTSIPVSEALASRIRVEVEETLHEEYERRLRSAVQRARAESQDEHERAMADLVNQLVEQRRKAQEAQERELALLKRARELEERQQELDLEVARRVDVEKSRIEQELRRVAAEQYALKLKEKDSQIEDLKNLLDEARRKSEQGSQERQGEVLELDLEEVLKRSFPQDVIRPVPKGIRGADLIQEVRDAALQPCGAILWETKNTRQWSPGWIQKLKDDQRAAGASLAILVSVALPDDLRSFGLVDGVWVSGIGCYLPLAVALRERLIQVAFARKAAEGMHDKMESLYAYLSGDEFRQRVEAIVETFRAMEDQLSRERRAMERLWKEREKQIERVVMNTVGMYGAIRGIIGARLPEIPALELEALAPPESDS